MKRRLKRIFLVPCAWLLLAAAAASLGQDEPAAEGPGFKVVVNAANPTAEMKTRVASRVFKKIIVRWESWEENGDKVRIVPVDQAVESAVREAFTHAVHGRGVDTIVSYWSRKIFGGHDSPPRIFSSDQEVLDFVGRERGAIGYVARDTELGKDVKELAING